MTRKIDVASGLVITGAVLLFISLFLDWWVPDLAAWDAFEALDLALAGIAVTCIVIAAGWLDGQVAPAWLPILAFIAFATVLVQILDEPPTAFIAAQTAIDREDGIWVGLVSTIILGLGAAMRFAQVSVELEISPRGRTPRGDSEARTEVVPTAPPVAAAPPPPPPPAPAAPAPTDAAPDEPVGTKTVRRSPPAAPQS